MSDISQLPRGAWVIGPSLWPDLFKAQMPEIRIVFADSRHRGEDSGATECVVLLAIDPRERDCLQGLIRLSLVLLDMQRSRSKPIALYTLGRLVTTGHMITSVWRTVIRHERTNV